MITTYASNFIVAVLIYIITAILGPIASKYTKDRPPVMSVLMPENAPESPLLTENDYCIIAEEIASQIKEKGRPEEIFHNGILLSFQGKTSQETTTEYTGVEFLGMKESYLETRFRLDNLQCEGIFNEDGEEIFPSVKPDIRHLLALTNQYLN